VLELEYKQQYDQYRWIGQQQTTVLTLYSAISAFLGATVAALRPDGNNPDPEYLVLVGIVLIFIGLLGIAVGVGLFKSRLMQRRTGQYITLLLRNLVEMSTEPTKLKASALHFRALCTTGSEFSLLDTMNSAILLTIVGGEGFAIAGLMTVAFGNLTFATAVLFVLIFSVLGRMTYCRLQKALQTEISRIEGDRSRIAKTACRADLDVSLGTQADLAGDLAADRGQPAGTH
jgi:hypothetical protein